MGVDVTGTRHLENKQLLNFSFAQVQVKRKVTCVLFISTVTLLRIIVEFQYRSVLLSDRFTHSCVRRPAIFKLTSNLTRRIFGLGNDVIVELHGRARVLS